MQFGEHLRKLAIPCHAQEDARNGCLSHQCAREAPGDRCGYCTRYLQRRPSHRISDGVESVIFILSQRAKVWPGHPCHPGLQDKEPTHDKKNRDGCFTHVACLPRVFLRKRADGVEAQEAQCSNRDCAHDQPRAKGLRAVERRNTGLSEVSTKHHVETKRNKPDQDTHQADGKEIVRLSGDMDSSHVDRSIENNKCDQPYPFRQPRNSL
ncbi:hypothetical protein D3C81_1276300 [compost metagenome]